MNADVDRYIREAKPWSKELAALRLLVLDAGLTEAFKWRAPCYLHGKKNVVLLGAFKEFCVVSFFKGALLKDPKGILEKPGENTQAARIIRITDGSQVDRLTATIKAYVREAIQVEESGQKVDRSAAQNLELPSELQTRLDQDTSLRTAFEALTPGRQRAYAIHISGAKQAKTREDRIDKCRPKILDGKGLNDCTCGLSKRMPGCDGSHKQLKS